MKYGLLVHKDAKNIGDDIQSYAVAQFLPRVDMMIDREKIDIFKYGDGSEPVAMIMGAWWMWRKFNWPPAKQIIPLMVGYHHYQREENLKKAVSYSTPVFNENYTGVGGEWLKAYAPVGCRDNDTCKLLEKFGIPNYFSGCVTLTLPKQPITKENGKYVCLVDLDKKVEEKVRKLIGNKYKIIKLSHIYPSKPDTTWKERKKEVEELLTLYQNAKYVVTSRLHVALPCLAMEVPVLVVQKPVVLDPYRFDPYAKWLHYYKRNEFLGGCYQGFDFENGTPNKKDYLETREKLTKSMREFVNYCEENKDKPLEFFNKIKYTDNELLEWKVNFLRETLNKTHVESKKMFEELKALKKQETSLLYIISKKIYNKVIKNSKLKQLKIIKKIKNTW